MLRNYTKLCYYCGPYLLFPGKLMRGTILFMLLLAFELVLKVLVGSLQEDMGAAWALGSTLFPL